MPLVPRVTRQVETGALPGVRKQAHETYLSTGVGLSQAREQEYEALGGLGQIGAHIASNLIVQERERADQTAVLEAENRLAKWENNRLYDPQEGALTQKGKDSFGLPEAVGSEFEQQADDAAQGLTNDRQRQAFARVRTQRGISIDATLRRHVFGEMQRYEGEEVQARLQNAQDAIINNATDRRRIADELEGGVAAIRQHGPRLGLGPEQIQHQVEAFVSASHVGVIERLLANDNDQAAQQYYDDFSDHIAGASKARVEKQLAEGSLRSQSTKLADQILKDPTLDTITKQEEKAKELAGDNAQLRDHLNQRLEHANAVKEKADRDAEEATLKTYFDIVDRTHDVADVMKQPGWSNLTGAQRAGLRSYADNLARGIATETDPETYYRLMTSAATSPEDFAKTNMLSYRPYLSDGDWKSLVGLQANVRKGAIKEDPTLAGFQTRDQVLKDLLPEYGFTDVTPKDGTQAFKQLAAIRSLVDDRVRQEELRLTDKATGKTPKLDNGQIRGLAREVLETQTGAKGGLLSGILYGWTPGHPLFDTTKHVYDMEATDVPADRRKQIEDMLRARKRPISDQTVLEVWRAYVLGGGK